MNEEKIEYGKNIGEIYSDYDLFEEPTKLCPVCDSQLEWNGFCSECVGEAQ